MSSSISARLLRGSLWISLARVMTNGLATLSMFVLAWNLAPADFGLVAIGTTFILILASVTEFSLSAALVRHESPDESHLSAAWTLNVLRGGVLCLLTWALAYPMAAVFGDRRLISILVALGISLLISGFANPRLAMAQRELQFWQDFVVMSGQKLVGFIVAVTVAIVFKSYWALILGTLATQAANVLLSYAVMPFRPRVLFRYWREFFAFSGWLTASQIVNTLNWRFDELLVGKLLGSTALGYYTVGGNLAVMPTRESTAPLVATIYPAFAGIRSDPPRLREAYRRSQALLSAIALPAGIGTAVIAEPLVQLMLGERWLPVTFIVQALASIFALQTLGSLAQALGLALGESRLLFIRDSQLLAIRVPIIVAGVMLGGLFGLVIARVGAGLIGIAFNLMLVRRFLGVRVREQVASNMRTLVSSGVMAATVLLLSRAIEPAHDKVGLAFHLAGAVVVGALTYLATMSLLWWLSGRPAGAETEASQLMRKLLGRLRGATV